MHPVWQKQAQEPVTGRLASSSSSSASFSSSSTSRTPAVKPALQKWLRRSRKSQVAQLPISREQLHQKSEHAHRYTHTNRQARAHTETHTPTENHGWPADLMIRSIDQLGPQVSLARETAMFTSMPVATNPARGLQGVKLASFECPSKAFRN